MKKTLLLIICVLVSGCSGGAKKKTLADALSGDPYEYLAKKLSGPDGRMPGRKVAVLPFSYTDKRESDDGVVISERLLTRLIQEGKLEAVERNLLEKVMGELKLQYSGAVDEASIKSLGRVLGVDAVVTGTIMRQADGRIEINARLIKAETAVILAAAGALVPCDWETGIMSAGMEQAGSGPEAAPQPAAPEKNAQPEDFPAAWKYRENLRVAERSGASLVDHQVLVKLDTAGPVRLGRMKPDCSDLRFTNSNEVSLLNHWLESGCNTSETRVWVRLPFLARNSVKNIYAYYGNRAAQTGSSGEKTFVFFDDFEGQGPDAVKWRFLRGDCPVAQAGGRLKFTGCGLGSYTRKSALASVPDFRPPYVLEFDGWSSDSGENGMYREIDLRWDGECVGHYNQANSAVGVLLYDGFSVSAGCRTNDCIAGQATVNPWQNGAIDLSNRSPGRPLTPGVWRRYRITDDGELVTVHAGSDELLSARVSGPSGEKLGLSAREYPRGGEVHYDNFRVRRFAQAEPEVYLYVKGNAKSYSARYPVTR